jgi:hypothetical protein
MAQELHFTSAPRGLRPGTQGFCTVAASPGLPPQLWEQLERLSAYRPFFPAGDPRFGQNPVAWSHRLLAAGRSVHHALSRVAIAPPDYTGRTNFYAHHLILAENELFPGGPAWLLRQPGVMDAAWRGEPRAIARPRQLPAAPPDNPAGRAWRAATGDANWGWALAEAWKDAARRPTFLLFVPGQDLLALLDEAIRLLPPERQWQVEFTTYSVAPGDRPGQCLGVLAGSPAAEEAIRKYPDRILDLSRPLGAAPAPARRTEVKPTPSRPVSTPALNLPPDSAGAPIRPVQPPPRPVPAARPRVVRQKPAPEFWLGWVAAAFLFLAGLFFFYEWWKTSGKLAQDKSGYENEIGDLRQKLEKAVGDLAQSDDRYAKKDAALEKLLVASDNLAKSNDESAGKIGAIGEELKESADRIKSDESYAEKLRGWGDELQQYAKTLNTIGSEYARVRSEWSKEAEERKGASGEAGSDSVESGKEGKAAGKAVEKATPAPDLEKGNAEAENPKSQSATEGVDKKPDGDEIENGNNPDKPTPEARQSVRGREF